MEGSQSFKGQNDPYTWFTESQLQYVIKNGVVPEWFHGIISRKTAEELLVSKPPGYFLIRVSESRIGYTLSYRAEDRCRHFMIDALKDGYYIIVGENRYHRFLQDLVDFHRRTPIMPYSQVLTIPCGQASNDRTDYAELLFPSRGPGSRTSLPPNNSQLPSISQPGLQEDIPPALPYRPNNLGNSPPLSKKSQSDRLYPSLEDEFQDRTTPPTAPPAPMTRKRYMADNPPSNQPPEVPSRNCVALKQIQATRTVSAPESLPTLTGSEQPPCTNIPHVKNQEAKLSAVINLKNFKKKFHKKREPLQDNSYSEINTETTNRGENAEHEYQEITGQQTFCEPPLSSTCTHPRLTDEVLPLEYMPPPPFAPGF
ncbi:hematopoietic SH2 domain-containing protein homolog [Archocentrus centrarchus]|uniref:hematopoietic SH2 domain-containing protein homolog n=1 Tax=Archocentrus centrarchus TaxID=63155 RepID=UPI0011EA2E83|nr:hematopoietic SH2 domain-containing protein [Archocentrus centrarchus]